MFDEDRKIIHTVRVVFSLGTLSTLAALVSSFIRKSG